MMCAIAWACSCGGTIDDGSVTLAPLTRADGEVIGIRIKTKLEGAGEAALLIASTPDAELFTGASNVGMLRAPSRDGSCLMLISERQEGDDFAVELLTREAVMPANARIRVELRRGTCDQPEEYLDDATFASEGDASTTSGTDTASGDWQATGTSAGGGDTGAET